ncbi:hypothetical protein [Nannocystis punicea]|uniref:VWFA domain-containing protein n=1 Tax=Nannocystis punicea TaxID=2995304 RepID=A0ABY7H4V5_9BACT|nr:hypothetical protein [Nannocystis poenicansa]WAS94301.1 hypothetical protein O0S08_49905 [Nannocystis poenicansa]
MRRSARFAVESFIGLAVVAGCGDSGGPSPATATGITGATGLTGQGTPSTTGPDSPGGDSTGVPTTSGDSSAGTTESPPPSLPKLDLGEQPEGTGEDDPLAAGCKKIDFLFVVDNSGSMADEQANLIASFPGFIATITGTLTAKDYHIMTVSTDNGMNTGLSSTCTNGTCNCTPAPVCCENACGGSGKTCNGFDCNDLPLSQCHFEYGTGKEFDATGKHCMLADMRRYMTESQPELAQTFECIANVGTYGSGDEKPMLAATSALGDTQNAAGGCDEGFLRDDALLVLVFITDEEDNVADDGKGSPGEPADWFKAVVAAKGGEEKAAVVLGLIGDSNLPMGQCQPGVDPNMGDGNGAEDAPRLQSFVQMFTNGKIGSVCASDYTPFFNDAVSVIDTACDQFEPPG